ncbi:nuclear transport factor 2 family protein [Roseibium sp. SCP14]|uniref:nuclear transport factor 2 family protein n=1 Tax=Roseibium sp. SCP14 TaxID=3141375 RepID=UPI00333A7BAC
MAEMARRKAMISGATAAISSPVMETSMNAKDQILKLINQYSFTLDSGDLDGFADLFKDGEWIFEGSEPNRGRQELYDNVLTLVILYEDGTPRTRHATTNVNIEVDEEAGTATSQRYVIVVQQTDKLPLQVIYSGQYFDEFARREDGSWYYTRLTIRNPLFGDLSHHLRTRLDQG